MFMYSAQVAIAIYYGSSDDSESQNIHHFRTILRVILLEFREDSIGTF